MLDGSWLSLKGSAIRLSFNPCPFSLVMSMNNSCRKRWQGYRFSSFNSLFLNLLGVNLPFSLSS